MKMQPAGMSPPDASNRLNSRGLAGKVLSKRDDRDLPLADVGVDSGIRYVELLLPFMGLSVDYRH